MIHVRVTQYHIDDAFRGSMYHCPIALALADTTRDTWSVGLASAYQHTPSGHVVRAYPLPVTARWKARDFDQGYDIEPFEFDLGD